MTQRPDRRVGAIVAPTTGDRSRSFTPRERRVPRALAILPLLVPLALAGGMPAFAQDIDVAHGLLGRGLDDLAALEYRAVLDADPSAGEAAIARYGLGVALHRLGRLDEAAAALAPAADGPAFAWQPAARLLAARCDLARGRPAEAAPRLEALLADTPGDPLAGAAAALLVEARFRAGGRDAAETARAVARATALLASIEPDGDARLRAEYLAARAEADAGRLDAAAERLAARPAVAAAARRNAGPLPADAPPVLADALVLLARARLVADDPARARVCLRAAGPIADRPALEAERLHLLALAARRADAVDDVVLAAEALERLASAHREAAAAHLAPVRFVRARTALDRGDADAALAALEAAGRADAACRERGGDAAPGTLDRAELDWWRGRAELVAGRFTRAVAALAAARDACDARGDVAGSLRASHDLVVAHVRAGDDAGAVAAGRALLDGNAGDAARGDAELAALLRDATILAMAAASRTDDPDTVERLHAQLPTDLAGGRVTPTALLLLADAAVGRGDDEAAAQRYRAALDRIEAEAGADASANDVRDEATRGLGLALVRLGRAEEAEPLLARAAARPGGAGAACALADRRLAGGDPEGALSALSVLAPADAARGDVRVRRATALRALDRHREAIEALGPLLRGPAGAEASALRRHARLLAGLSRTTLDDPAARRAGIADLRAVAGSDDDARARTAWRRLAALAEEGGDLAGAVRAVEAWVARSADDADRIAALDALARLHLAAGDEPEAADVLARRLALAGDPVAETRLAVAEARRATDAGARTRALAGLRRACDGFAKDGGGPVVPAPLRAVAHYERAWLARTAEGAAPDEVVAAYAAADAAARASGDDALRRRILIEDAAWRHDGGAADAAAGRAPVDPSRHEAVRTRLETAIALAPNERDELDRAGRHRLAVVLHEQAGAGATEGAAAPREGADAHARAADAFETWRARYPDDPLAPNAALLAAQHHAARGAWGRAVALLEPIAGRGGAPEEVARVALLRLGEAHASRQAWAASERAFRTWLERYAAPVSPSADEAAPVPGERVAAFGTAWAIEQQGRLDAAIEAYRAVAAGPPDELAARARFQEGECQFALGRLEEAARTLLSVELRFDHPQWAAAALHEAARVLERMGRTEDAAAQRRRLQEHYGDTTWARLARDAAAQANGEEQD